LAGRRIAVPKQIDETHEFVFNPTADTRIGISGDLIVPGQQVRWLGSGTWPKPDFLRPLLRSTVGRVGDVREAYLYR